VLVDRAVGLAEHVPCLPNRESREPREQPKAANRMVRRLQLEEDHFARRQGNEVRPARPPEIHFVELATRTEKLIPAVIGSSDESAHAIRAIMPADDVKGIRRTYRRRGGYPRGMLSILDGDVMDSADARVSILDEGLLRGDGVFEVVRVYAGRPFGLEEHLERMVRSAASIRLPFDADLVRADAAALLEAAGEIDAAMRLVATRGGRRIGILHPLPAFPETVALATITYAPTRVLDGVKSLSYGANMLATRLAKEAGADEALLVTPHGRVLEAPVTSFFYVLQGDLCTPPLSDRILDSISRRVLLQITDARERVTTLDDLEAISEAFLASSLREVQPVGSIDGRAMPAAPGPISADCAARVREHIEAALAATT